MTHIALSGNMLKIIAAVCMLIDHVGYILLPDVPLLRIIGRLAFPIFAFMIAEGCRYTRNKLRYFCFMAVFAAVMQCVYYVFTQSMFMNVFVTFSLSILLIYVLHLVPRGYIRIAVFAITAALIYILNMLIKIDYGFWGCILPVFASVFTKDNTHRVALFAIGLLILSAAIGGVQPYCLLAVVLLLFYSGKRGKHNMKYFFYIFYPLHLAVLYGINMLLN